MEPVVVFTDRAPKSPSPLSQAIRFGNVLFVSGQVPVDPTTGQAVGGSITDQTRQVLENLKAIVEDAGASMDNVLKTTCFLTDIGMAPEFNRVYRSYFPSILPARSTFQVAGLAGGILVEIEAVVGLPGAG